MGTIHLAIYLCLAFHCGWDHKGLGMKHLCFLNVLYWASHLQWRWGWGTYLSLRPNSHRTRNATRMQRFSFDLPFVQCEHAHWWQQVPFACVALHCSSPHPHRTRTRNAKQIQPVYVNGSIHNARKQHQRICVRICVRASCVDWTLGLYKCFVLSLPFAVEMKMRHLSR